jgi:hypothetical protein
LDHLGPCARQSVELLAGAVLHLFHRLHVVIAEGLETIVEFELAPVYGEVQILRLRMSR